MTVMQTTHPSKWFRIFGPPGTGKTTRLLNEVDKLLLDGVPGVKIGFFAFTRKAANEAKGRAMERFSLSPDDVGNFRTLHSFCFRHSGIGFDQLMTKENWRELSESVGFDLGWDQKDPDAVEDLATALPDKQSIINLITMARIKQITYRQAYDQWDYAHKHPWNEVLYISLSYDKYREMTRTYDFTDMLIKFLENAGETCPTFHTVFIDEAQDLSPLQWKVVKAISNKSERVIVAGDDDQAIFRWAGADVDTFLKLPGMSETLSKSWRIPAQVHSLAESVAGQIANRYPKKYLPKEDKGSVFWIHGVESILPELEEGTWLILAQCAYMLEETEELLLAGGFFFETKNRKSVPDKVIMAVAAWKKLQSDQEISGEEVRAIYNYLRVGTDVRRGFKTAPGLEDDDYVTYDDLQRDVGLLVEKNRPWFSALSKIPEKQNLYLRSIENRGENFQGKARIVLSTIHGAKGGEADNVILFTDQSHASAREAQKNVEGSNDLHRTFYVGITRTKNRLFLVTPRSEKEAYRLDHLI